MNYSIPDNCIFASDNLNVQNICKKITSTNQENSFYVCDIGDIIKKLNNWKCELPRVTPYYAVKCNDNEIVLRVLAALGINFDCASQDEIRCILKLGVNPNRIIFAHTTKPRHAIGFAQTVGVSKTTFDSEAELNKIKELHPKAKAVIRIRYDSKESLYQLGGKYGCDPVNDAPRLLRFAKGLGINVIGVSFHVGSGCSDPSIFTEAIECAKSLFDYAAELGFDFNLLDIGGGFPGDKNTSIKEYSECINSALDRNFSDSRIEIIAEPGRYFVASAMTLATNVHSIRKVYHKDDITGLKSVQYMYYINDSIYTSFICTLFENTKLVPIILNEPKDGRKYRSTIWGSTCCSMDVITKHLLLPQLRVGDWLLFENMGAYSLCLATNFNKMPIPVVFHVVDKTFVNNFTQLKNVTFLEI